MPLFDFMSGAITFGFLTAALFFLRFWRRIADGLFLAFAASFALLGVGQAIQALSSISREETSYLYLFRLVAFLLIIGAVIRKNREPRKFG